jgi:hypothetical protein
MSTDAPQPPAGLRVENVTARVVEQKVWRRCNVNNEHFMGAIVGREGSGKSGTALRLGEVVDPSFHADRVFFEPANFMEWVDADARDPGDAAVVDEAGVGVGSRSWYEKDQILLNQALQTARDDNLAVFFTLPRLTELDSQTRGRLHAFLEIRAKEDGEHADVAWKNVVPSRDEEDKLYKKYPRMRVDGRERRITSVRITPPSPSLWESYKERKAAFKDELYEETIQALRDADDGDDRSPKEIAEEIVEEETVNEYVSVHGGNKTRYIDWKLIRSEYDLSRHDAKAVKSLLEKKEAVPA